MQGDMRFIIFDFCFTLVRCNTTNQFIKYIFAKSGGLRKLWILVVVCLSKVSYIFSKNSRNHELILSFSFVLISLQDYKKLTEGFVEDFLIKNINDKVFDFFVSRSRTTNTLVCTNTLEDIVDYLFIVKKIDSKCVGSKLCHNGKFITFGYSSHVLKAGKVNTLVSRLNKIEVDEFWTDDLEADADLISLSQQTIFVNGEDFERI